tara:strand:+ start:243 stop:485 length:243 start_codon:yes stop_codon:yes gene_type:complete
VVVVDVVAVEEAVEAADVGVIAVVVDPICDPMMSIYQKVVAAKSNLVLDCWSCIPMDMGSFVARSPITHANEAIRLSREL